MNRAIFFLYLGHDETQLFTIVCSVLKYARMNATITFKQLVGYRDSSRFMTFFLFLQIQDYRISIFWLRKYCLEIRFRKTVFISVLASAARDTPGRIYRKARAHAQSDSFKISI